MTKIPFQNSLGSGTLSTPTGAAGAVYVTINNYHQGMFVKYKGRWEFKTNNTDLTEEMIEELRGMLRGD